MRTEETAAVGGMAGYPGAQGNSKPAMDVEPEWKKSFRQTLDEIKDVGFGSYAQKINEEKLEELRKKILASMGLSEQDLEKMSPEQRAQIEKMVSLEIQRRLAAEDALEADENAAEGGQAAPGEIAGQVRASPNGMGAGLLILQAIDDSGPASDAPSDEKKNG